MSNINLHLGDCLEAMKEMPDNTYDLAIVDPPYGIDLANMNMGAGKSKKASKIENRKWTAKDWDKHTPTIEYFDNLIRVSKEQIIWGGNYFPFIWGFGGRCFIYWHKGNPVSNFADGELAWTSFDKNAKQFNYRYYGNLEGNTSTGVKFHPTQKPIALYEWLLMNYAKEGDKILDTHLGSGSIALACHNLGFDLTACELDKEYYEAAIKRIEQHQSQQRLF